MLRSALILLLALVFSAPAMAADIVMQQIPNAKKVGEGRLSIAFWDVYDATLYAPNGEFDREKPHALSIRYFREIEGADIVERSVEEMKKQGLSDQALMADWKKQMQTIFPNVKDGTVLTAILTAEKSTDFYHKDNRIGSIKSSVFSKYFFDIWLSEKTSEPALRRALLGQS